MNGRKGQPTLLIDLHTEGLLGAFMGIVDGPERWNAMMQRMFDVGLIDRAWDDEDDEAEEPWIVFGLLMEDADLCGLAMPGVDLSHVYMERCRFDGCDMRGARLAVCPRCSFRDADLRGASFGPVSDLTACDFTGAITDDSTLIEQGFFDEGHPPPIGLPQHLLAKCRPEPAEEREPLVGMKNVPIRITAGLMIPGSLG